MVCLLGAALIVGGCGKSPQEVCDQLGLLAKPSDNFSPGGCLAAEQRQRRIYGRSWYRGRGRCVGRAISYTSARLCRGVRDRGKKHSATFRLGGKKKKPQRAKRKRRR